MSNINLRPWQSEAITKALYWFLESKAGKHFLVNAAPGSGKTICASMIAKRLLDQGAVDRVIVIAPRAEVVRQWGEEYKFVTNRHMSKVTGSEAEIEDYGTDLCATWAAIQGLLEGFQQVCRTSKTLIICDEHHHAAVEAAWGKGANSAFAEAAFVLILTGTPIRSDGQEPIWFAYDDMGRIDHPEEGTYTLTYGKAVDLGYCRPITFHRHEGRFNVSLNDGETIVVSGTAPQEVKNEFNIIPGLKQALDFYKLACTPRYLPDEKTPDRNSYQGSMLESGILKLNEIRHAIPNAGGLVIAPNIEVAEYMAALLEELDGEKPTIVHSQMQNAEGRIAAFKNTNKKWLVSVAMISEGVDIKRLRILVYLPSAQTELAFRQAMGRVVRSLGDEDTSRAYVVMPTHRIFEEWAKRVEREMSPVFLTDSPAPKTKICPDCHAECPKNAKECTDCGHVFSSNLPFKECHACGALNPLGVDKCQSCGQSFKHDFDITLAEAVRMGAIIRGMELSEDEVRDGELHKNKIYSDILSSGDEVLIGVLKRVPPESWGRLRKILNCEI